MINFTAIVVTAVANMETWLKIALLIATLGVTLTKWAFMIIDRRKKKKNEDEQN
jgi:hypothetical protein